MKRKTIINMSILFLLAGLLSFGNWASASAADLNLDDQPCAAVGNSVTFTVTVDNAPNQVAALGFDVTYDNTILQFDSYEGGALVANFDFFKAAHPDNLIRVGGFEAGADNIPAGATGTLVFLTFTVLAEGSTDLVFLNLKDDMKEGWTTDDGTFCPGAELAVDKTALDFGSCETGDTFNITNEGDGTLTWTISIDYIDGDGWITVVPTGGDTTTETDTVTVTVDRAGLNPGDYAATLTVTSNDGVATIDVTMSVGLPDLGVDPTTLDFGTSEKQKSFDISNTGDACSVLSWTATPVEAWITVDPAQGTRTPEEGPVEVVVTVDRSTLGVGPHTGTVTVDSNGGTQDVTILVTVPEVPVLGLNPTALEFESWETDETEKTFNITNQGTGTLEWSITPNEPWITTTPTGAGTGPVEVKVKVNRTGKDPGVYNGVASVTSNGGNQDVAVTMDVGITISGTVWDILAEDEIPVPGARVSVVEHEAHGCTATCDGEGNFELLNVPPNEKMHIVILGPEPGVEYVDTYYAYFTTGTDNIQEGEVPILRKAEMDELVDFVGADKTKGIVAGPVGTQVGDDLEDVAGAKVSVTDMDDKPIDASVLYFDSMGEPDLDLEETSSDGGYVVYNIGGVPRDVKVVAQKPEWTFAPVEAHVHPYEANPTSVTVAPVAGQEEEEIVVTEGAGGGCFISTAAY